MSSYSFKTVLKNKFIKYTKKNKVHFKFIQTTKDDFTNTVISITKTNRNTNNSITFVYTLRIIKDNSQRLILDKKDNSKGLHFGDLLQDLNILNFPQVKQLRNQHNNYLNNCHFKNTVIDKCNDIFKNLIKNN